jgi:methionyl-tRNA formyltransferase
MDRFVIATIKSWNIQLYNELNKKYPKQYFLIDDPDNLTFEKLSELKPRYVFFPHWSSIIPDQIYQNFECVIFHMTDVPFGRGGSPLQNLISRGLYQTKICALKCQKELDSGPVYLKTDFSLEKGSAQELFSQASVCVFEMLEKIVLTRPEPVEQQGDVVYFKRRTPQMSELTPAMEVHEIYDQIRMLDAQDYPRAFIPYGDYILSFEQAQLHGGSVTATVTFKKNE